MVVERLNNASMFISKFALLNVLWLALIVAGLGVFGFFPATIALFMIARKWVLEGQQGKVVKPMVKIFKEHFLRANVFGYLMLAAGAVLYINYHLIQASEGSVPLFVVLAFLFTVTVYILFAVSIIPVSVHFEGGMRTVLLRTLQFVFGRFHITVLFGIVVWSVIYLSLSFPAVIIFFSGSVGSYMLMWFFNRSIEKIDQKQLENNPIALKG
ncbi:YesL family protein [Salisediminibacterium halotolerans]|uniref:Uncharacterized membrane protein YesL n=1 Tax=Salisediminibacterium halotolerans TaxID=517425 RepID=A0A1H9WJN8_9BACI|nr:DUF624 domain-containing protein [Salisediminibacterium haloalkalitolerans]SES34156.1 Uncharacterized membrane protein YesL [Salisediminibacterium haloalkalitolerans]